jgi:hypothetical protein
MNYARRIDGRWAEVDAGFEMAGTLYPANWADLVTDAERAALGIHEITETLPPADVEVIGSSLTGDAEPMRTWATVPMDMDVLRAQLTRAMNVSAGAFRSNFITDIPGQDATYLDKEGEARAYLTTGLLEPGGYIDEDATRTGRDPAMVVAEIVGQADAWRPLNRRIEGARIAAARAIGEAETPAAAREAAAVDWAALLAP